jgi:ParB family chromosome partitioning protein
MARKDLLKGLMDTPPDPVADPKGGGAKSDPKPPVRDENEASVDPARPRYSGGAIGAVSQSIADLKSRSVIEIDPFKVKAGGLLDRLEDDDKAHAALMESLRDHGQQVPILVRPHPDEADQYQIVYGRRRVLALRDLGIPVKALVRELDDSELVVAQGQENSARKDLSFIEKASFAFQMQELGYKRKVISAALHVDKTVISRMLFIAERINLELIRTIGAAPSVGRDRWLKLAEIIAEKEVPVGDLIAYANMLAEGPGSDDRFEAVMKGLTYGGPAKQLPKGPDPDVEVQKLMRADGVPIGKVVNGRKNVVLTLKHRESVGFSEWLAENISEIHRDWMTKRGE